jgi:hypothetical protein
MRLRRALVRFGQGVAWRTTHARTLGRHLVSALSDSDETARTVAGIMLAKSGAAAVPVLREALAQRRSLDIVLSLLGTVGDASVRDDIAPFAKDADPRVARAAREALARLAARDAPSAGAGKKR